MGHLRTLRLNGCGLGEHGVAALAASPALAGLRELQIYNNGIGNRGAPVETTAEHEDHGDAERDRQEQRNECSGADDPCLAVETRGPSIVRDRRGEVAQERGKEHAEREHRVGKVDEEDVLCAPAEQQDARQRNDVAGDDLRRC